MVSTDPSVTTADWACVNCEKTFDCLKVMLVYLSPISSAKDVAGQSADVDDRHLSM